jgi:hypothetical protein
MPKGHTGGGWAGTAGIHQQVGAKRVGAKAPAEDGSSGLVSTNLRVVIGRIQRGREIVNA